MTKIAIAHTVTMEDLECSSCGIIFALPVFFEKKRRDDHATFYCPNGHTQYFPHESDAEKNARLLREEQERHKRTLARVNIAEAKAAEETAKNVRLQKRVKAGVCPCCKRTFKQLAAHMHTKHPEFKP